MSRCPRSATRSAHALRRSSRPRAGRYTPDIARKAPPAAGRSPPARGRKTRRAAAHASSTMSLMLSRPPRTARHRLLAAPLVMTAALSSAACAHEPDRVDGPIMNPPPPVSADTIPPAARAPTAVPRAEAAPTPPVAASAQASATTPSDADLPDVPPTALQSGGHVVQRPDGTCAVVFPEPKMPTCPPTAYCNPGPPRAPLKVKCPSGPAPKH